MRTGEDDWGPWARDIDRAERLARVRSLRALSHARYGIEHGLTRALFRAESLEDGALGRALAALDALPALDRRKLTSLYQSMASMRLADDARAPFRRRA